MNKLRLVSTQQATEDSLLEEETQTEVTSFYYAGLAQLVEQLTCNQ